MIYPQNAGEREERGTLTPAKLRKQELIFQHLEKDKNIIGVGGTPTQRGGENACTVRTVKNKNRLNLCFKFTAALLALSILAAPVAPACAADSGWVDWSNFKSLGKANSYTAAGDGFIIFYEWVDGGGHGVTVTSADGTKSYSVDAGGYDENTGTFTFPVNKGDKVTVNSGTKNHYAYYIPASGGTSVDDLKEELKKGTFENIKTQTLETTGNATVDGNLTVKGNTQLGDSTADTTGISGNATVGKDLSVTGNETVNGNEVIRNFIT